MNKLINTMLILAVIGVVVVFGILVFEEFKTDYEMPNGVICETIFYGDTKTFTNCLDGKKYINPEFYKEIKK